MVEEMKEEMVFIEMNELEQIDGEGFFSVACPNHCPSNCNCKNKEL